MDRESPLTLAEALDRLPKVELHCHVEATMRPETLVELAASISTAAVELARGGDRGPEPSNPGS